MSPYFPRKCLHKHYLHDSLSITETSSNVELHLLGKCIDNSHLLITDVLALKSVYHKFHYRPITVRNCRQETLNAFELNTSELVELLQKSATEHLTTYRQLQARDFGSVAAIVTTDFEALYAYKHGKYQRCLQLSTQNVRTLISHQGISFVLLYPEFTQLMDDDIVSVVALTLIVDPSRRKVPGRVSVDQLSLSVYLMVKCQMQLHHSVTSLAQSLDYIQAAHRRHHELLRHNRLASSTLDLLILKLAERKNAHAIHSH